jgi:hypothetical protein
MAGKIFKATAVGGRVLRNNLFAEFMAIALMSYPAVFMDKGRSVQRIDQPGINKMRYIMGRVPKGPHQSNREKTRRIRQRERGG